MTTLALNIAIVGAAGRMGRELIELAASDPCLAVVAAIEHPGSAQLGEPIGPDGLVVSGDLSEVVSHCDVVIDFSTPESCVRSAQIATRAHRAFVSGTTGLSDALTETLHQLSRNAPLLYAANFSVGVNLALRLVELASAVTGEEFDIEICEAHHRQKLDAPSGTALALGRAAAAGRGLELQTCGVFERQGQTGARQPNAIGFSVIRGGDIVGEHSVLFCGDGERIEIAHRATDRGIFAKGALRAARWLSGQSPGFYSMSDMLFG